VDSNKPQEGNAVTYTLNRGSPVRISYSLANTSFAGHPTLGSRYPSGRRLTDVLDAYRASPEWRQLAPSTQRIWVLIVNRIRERWGETPIELWSNPEQLMEIIRRRNQRAHMPRMADHQLTVLHHFLAWARLHGEVTVNLASGIPRLYRPGGRAEIIWHEDEITRFCTAAPRPVADGMRLAALTGLRRADLVGLSWSEISVNKIARVTLKSRRRRKRAIIPVTPALGQLLDELATRTRKRGVSTVLVHAFGGSWTPPSFGHAFGLVRDELDIRHSDGRKKHLYDVRGTYASRLVLLGLSDQQIGDILGWSTAQVSEVRKLYVQDDAAIIAISEKLART
jgi:integrase